MRTRHAFPKNVFEVFETFVDNRLRTDEQRIAAKFRFSCQEVREFSEEAAFTMQVDAALGLSPSVDQLVCSLANDLGYGNERLRDLLDSVVTAGFGTVTKEGGIERFSFGHRRLQEYFATAVVLREPDRLPPKTVLLDGRWRETAVTLLQSRRPDQVRDLIEEATKLLEEMWPSVSGIDFAADGPIWFPWPEDALHVLGLLQDGLAVRPDIAAEGLRDAAGGLVALGYLCGTVLDRKWAIESAGAASNELFELVLTRGFETGYDVLRDAAYRQASRLIHLGNRLERFIRVSLLRQALHRDIQKQRLATFTHLRRLPNGERFVSLAKLLAFSSDLDYLMCTWPLIAGVGVWFLAPVISWLSTMLAVIGLAMTLLLIITHTPALADDSELLGRLKGRWNPRYFGMGVSAVIAILTFPRAGQRQMWTSLGCVLFGVVLPLLVWISLGQADKDVAAANWLVLPWKMAWRAWKIAWRTVQQRVGQFLKEPRAISLETLRKLGTPREFGHGAIFLSVLLGLWGLVARRGKIASLISNGPRLLGTVESGVRAAFVFLGLAHQYNHI